jgi:hypothetical protein
LYLPSVAACTGYDCANYIPNDCYCDYTTNNCGTPFGDGKKHLRTFLKSTGNCTCSTSYCDKSLHNWKDLTINNTQTVILNALSDAVHFRFLIENSCSAVKLVVEQIYGAPQMYVGTQGPVDALSAEW